MSSLLAHRVGLDEEPGDLFRLIFDCFAEDEDHAAEQAESAYPGCVVRHTCMRAESSGSTPSAGEGKRNRTVEETANPGTMDPENHQDTGAR